MIVPAYKYLDDINGAYIFSFESELEICEDKSGNNHRKVNELIDEINNKFFITFRDIKNINHFESYQAKIYDDNCDGQIISSNGELITTHERCNRDGKLFHRVTAVIKPIFK